MAEKVLVNIPFVLKMLNSINEDLYEKENKILGRYDYTFLYYIHVYSF